MTDNTIYFKNICKQFDGKVILDNISGEFYSNKINMLVGPSGTGKSILFKCILGLIPVDRGDIFFGEDKMVFSESFSSNEHLYKKGIGMLQQDPILDHDKTISENVRLPLDLLTSQSLEEKNAAVDEVLKNVGLLEAKDQMPPEISGGMRKRVSLARSIINKPKYLFCDEPDSGLDPEKAKEIDELIATISSIYQITTIIVTHNLDSIIRIGEHIIFLYKTKKMWDGDKKDIYNTQVKEFNEFLKSSDMFKKYAENIK
ncbi:MAG: ATP-binding cassette domain-containing protein [Cytophagales bacterium]|nr:ATP-binding cassette domain-containing protein [Cytophagales bacterium]